MQKRRRSLFRGLLLFPFLLPVPFLPSVQAETGISPSRILLGQSAGLSGPAAYISRQAMIGAQVYFDKINQQGGVHGRRIELLTRDDKYTASLAAYNTRQFIESDKVFALFGYVGWPGSRAALPIAVRAQVPFFAPFTGGSTFYQPFNRYLFTVRASYADEYAYFLRSVSGLGIRKVALAYQQDQYGVFVRQEVEDRARAEGVELTAIDVDMDGVNLSSVFEKIIAAQTDVVMLVNASHKTNARIVRGLRSKGFLGQFFGVSFIGQKALADDLGELARGFVVTQVAPFPWRISMPLVAEYRKRMAEAGHENLTFSSLEGYIAARVLVEGLKRASRDLTRERLIRSLESISSRNYDGGGYAINFSATNHNGSMYVDMAAMTRNSRFLN